MRFFLYTACGYHLSAALREIGVAGLKEMVRVAKPGGRILIVVPDADSEGRAGRSAMSFWFDVRCWLFCSLLICGMCCMYSPTSYDGV